VSEPEVYEEKARSYASLWAFAVIIGAGFVIDLIVGGGLAHLAGWLLAFVLVVGLNFVILYAVRSEKSLTLTADELRVGDDAVGRSEIVAVTSGVDDELPVLGWPLGKPRQLAGLTVRLFDGQQLVVPTRSPERLRAALGVDSVPEPANVTEVRAAARADLAELGEVAQRAETLFRTAGYQLPELPFDTAGLAKAKAVFVAGRPPVAFVRLDEVDGLAHIEELAVIPKCMRQGIGSALVERACEWARAHDYPAITLTTYADVPWNGPYYAKRGFMEVADPSPGLRAVRDQERGVGLDAVGRRIVMRRAL
jgi:GNAT superfamily N-acetyltransferase